MNNNKDNIKIKTNLVKKNIIKIYKFDNKIIKKYSKIIYKINFLSFYKL